MAGGGFLPPYVIVSLGFLGGGFFLWLVDHILPHIHQGTGHWEGIKTSWERSLLLVLAITFHNIPEGLAVGVAFGGLDSGSPAIGLAGTVSLAIGIGTQNFPEGAAVSIPLRRENMTRKKAFLIGQFSGMVEPMAAVDWCSSRFYCTATTLCSCLCGRCHDLCRGRRTDSRIAVRSRRGCCHDWGYVWLYGHDDFRRGTGIEMIKI